MKRAGLPGQESAWRKWLPSRTRWGAVAAGAYVAVALPCCVLYMLDPHEYSIPLLLLLAVSLPMYAFLFGLLWPLTHPLERVPCGEVLVFLLLILTSAAFYFGLGLVLSWGIRRLRGGQPGPGSRPTGSGSRETTSDRR